MKSIIILIIASFLLSACGKKFKPSADDIKTPINETEANTLDKPVKYMSVIILENEKPKCRISLQGREDLTPSFAEVHPEDDPVYTKRIVSFESAEEMTEEEREEVVAWPTEIVNLPNCEAMDEDSIAQMVPNMLLTDGSKEELASLANIIISSSAGLVIGCGSGFLIGYEGYTSNTIASVVMLGASVAGAITIGFTPSLFSGIAGWFIGAVTCVDLETRMLSSIFISEDLKIEKE